MFKTRISDVQNTVFNIRELNPEFNGTYHTYAGQWDTAPQRLIKD
jgi:hypothetical protein